MNETSRLVAPCFPEVPMLVPVNRRARKAVRFQLGDGSSSTTGRAALARWNACDWPRELFIHQSLPSLVITASRRAPSCARRVIRVNRRVTMSVVASSVANLKPAARVSPRVASRRSSVTVRNATIGDKFGDAANKLKKSIPNVKLPDVPNVKLPDVKVPVPGEKRSPGYVPAGTGEKLYVGQGKYIEADKDGFVQKTGRDSQLVGGFAGGEKGFWKYREILEEDPTIVKKKETKIPGVRKGTKEVNLAKDFGGLAGGFPGGEVGVKAYNATGNIPTRDAPPTIGWGPPVLLLAAIGAAGYYLNPGDPVEEFNTAVSSVEGAKATIDASLSPEQENLVLEGAGVALAVLVGSSVVGSAVKKVGEGLGNVLKTGLLGAAALGVAGKILEIW